MNDQTDEFFGEPISTYTDQQALEDGVLVAVPGDAEVNRVTRAVFDHFTESLGDDGYAAILEGSRVHWTVAFPVTGLTTTVRGPPVAVSVMVALLAGAAKLAGCPLVSNSR